MSLKPEGELQEARDNLATLSTAFLTVAQAGAHGAMSAGARALLDDLVATMATQVATIKGTK